MRPVFIFLALAGAGIIIWLIVAKPSKTVDTPKQQAIAVSKHSDSFNTAVNRLLNVYSLLKEDFVNWDSVKTAQQAIDMQSQLKNLRLDELQTDSAIYLTAQGFLESAVGDLQGIADEKTIRPQREAFNTLSDNFIHFLTTIKYDRQKLYLQECPMAFDDTQPAQWISDRDSIRNPYLGLHHPRYGRGMLSCGETKQTLNFTGKE